MLYEWQQKALTTPNEKALWCAEAGCGKTYAAGLWLQQDGRDVSPLVLCPKQIKEKWQDICPTATVLTPHDVRTKTLPTSSAVVIDEADEYASPLFVAKKRSKMAENVYLYLRDNPDLPVLLLTATPIRSTPWNIHTLLTYIGRYVDWKEYRKQYFYMDTPRYLHRPAWFPRPGWQKEMQAIIDEHAHVALMKDMVDHLPEERTEVISIKAPNYEKNEEWEASRQFVEDHRLEQSRKHTHVQSIAKGFRKVVVVAHYREQIDSLRDTLSKTRTTYVLDGRTKDPEHVIGAAEDASECYFIIQASVGAGFEIPSFSCMVFASQGYSVRNYVQMKARIRRINALKPVVYYHLLGGRCDRMVHNSINNNKDFVPSEYLRED